MNRVTTAARPSLWVLAAGTFVCGQPSDHHGQVVPYAPGSCAIGNKLTPALAVERPHAES